jgi:hypothetical protein
MITLWAVFFQRAAVAAARTAAAFAGFPDIVNGGNQTKRHCGNDQIISKVHLFSPPFFVKI